MFHCCWNLNGESKRKARRSLRPGGAVFGAGLVHDVISFSTLRYIIHCIQTSPKLKCGEVLF